MSSSTVRGCSSSGSKSAQQVVLVLCLSGQLNWRNAVGFAGFKEWRWFKVKESVWHRVRTTEACDPQEQNETILCQLSSVFL